MTPEQGLHVAIIPDGNRRWAKARSWFPWRGHEVAVENFRSLTDWCRNDPRVSVLTIWCFSTENWKRDPEEVRRLMQLLEDHLTKERSDFMTKNTRFVHSGRRDRIPASLKQLIEDIEEETKDNTSFTLHLAVDYGGKDELTRAMQKLTASHTVDISQDIMRNALDHPEIPDIDIIIRTSGEMRTSNFFLWQSTYAEWMFIEKHFPDFGTDDLEHALEEFDRRQRRFGS
jgi:undecaprenyl diphosphate synthase